MMMRLLITGAVIMGHTNTALSDVDEAVGSVEVGYDAETEYYAEDDDHSLHSGFDLDDIERRLGEAGVDISGEEYVFVDHINSRAYPPINADDNFDYKINRGSIHRRLIGDSYDSQKSDKWMSVDHEDAVMGCLDDDQNNCGLFVKSDVIDHAFNADMDLSNLDTRRLSAIDAELLTKECNDNDCTYAIDDDIIFADTEVMPQYRDESWQILVDTDALRRKLSALVGVWCVRDGTCRVYRTPQPTCKGGEETPFSTKEGADAAADACKLKLKQKQEQKRKEMLERQPRQPEVKAARDAMLAKKAKRAAEEEKRRKSEHKSEVSQPKRRPRSNTAHF